MRGSRDTAKLSTKEFRVILLIPFLVKLTLLHIVMSHSQDPSIHCLIHDFLFSAKDINTIWL